MVAQSRRILTGLVPHATCFLVAGERCHLDEVDAVVDELILFCTFGVEAWHDPTATQHEHAGDGGCGDRAGAGHAHSSADTRPNRSSDHVKATALRAAAPMVRRCRFTSSSIDIWFV